MSTSSAYTFAAFGEDHLTRTDRPFLPPGPHEVRIRVTAVSLNYRDLMMVRGLYNPKQPLPLVPCSDCVGVVEEVGEHVDEFKVGQRVIPCFSQTWQRGTPTKEDVRSSLGGPRDGTLRQHMVVPASALVEAPRSLTDVQAATLPCAGVTAWNALMRQGGLTAGQSVLLQGTGGVSLFALQIAHAAGARILITSSSNEKLDVVRGMGAHETINYVEQPGWGRAVRALTPDRRGVDHIVEVGGAATMNESLKAIRMNGHIALIGVLSGATEPIDVRPILMKNVRVQGIFVGHRDDLRQLVDAIDLHNIKPVVGAVFEWEEAVEAFKALASGQHMGKVCIKVG